MHSAAAEHTHRAGFTATGPDGQAQREQVCHVCAVEIPQAAWRKSTWSSYHGSCVEVAQFSDGFVGVRDTQDHGQGPVLVFAPAGWGAFLASLKTGGPVG